MTIPQGRGIKILSFKKKVDQNLGHKKEENIDFVEGREGEGNVRCSLKSKGTTNNTP